MPEKYNLLSREEAYRAGYELAVWDEFYSFEHRESLPEYARDAFHKYVETVILPQLKSTRKTGRIARAVIEQQQIWDDICAWEAVKDYREEQSWRKTPKDVSDAQRIVKQWQKGRPTPRAARVARKVVDAWTVVGRRVPLAVQNAIDALRLWSERGESAATRPSSTEVRLAFETVKWWNDTGVKNARSRRFSMRHALQMASKDLGMSPSGVRAACARAEKLNKKGFYVSELFLRTVKICAK